MGQYPLAFERIKANPPLMSDLKRAQDFLNAGDGARARELVSAALRDNPFDEAAWELALQLSSTDDQREKARAGLLRARKNSSGPVGPLTPVLSPRLAQDVDFGAIGQPERSNAIAGQISTPSKSFLAEAIVTWLLYYIGLGVVGLGANIYFLIAANRYREAGYEVQNGGCLIALLAAHMVLFVLGCLVALIVLVAPMLMSGPTPAG
ncbi:MAG: hypothetical protein GYB68_10680 [Chloroflexi bacterium]|nr:hypothetical protein [Chloroflexota bacterium]